MTKYAFIDGERIRKAHSVRQVEPIFEVLATGLAEIETLRFIKIFPERLSASSQLSDDRKKNPVVNVGSPGLVGVELLVDTSAQIVQFYAITSAVSGSGRRMVEAVLDATPEDWFVTVPFDWSGGFWQKMAEQYPRIQVF